MSSPVDQAHSLEVINTFQDREEESRLSSVTYRHSSVFGEAKNEITELYRESSIETFRGCPMNLSSN